MNATVQTRWRPPMSSSLPAVPISGALVSRLLFSEYDMRYDGLVHFQVIHLHMANGLVR